MIYSQPNKNEIIPYSTVKIDGCSEVTLGFEFLSEQPSVSKRRYCNKVLVHECVTVPESAPVLLDRAEFVATTDPCYREFSVFKSSEEVDSVPATITLQLNDDLETIGILVDFAIEDICCQPLRAAYRLYGYTPDDERLLLAHGNLVTTPCGCPDGVSPTMWTDIRW